MATGTDRAGTLELTAARLVEALKAHGQEHAQRVFAVLVTEYKLKDWEAKAVRSRFQELARDQGAPRIGIHDKCDQHGSELLDDD